MRASHNPSERRLHTVKFGQHPFGERPERRLVVISASDAALVGDNDDDAAFFQGGSDNVENTIDPFDVLDTVNPSFVDINNPISIQEKGAPGLMVRTLTAGRIENDHLSAPVVFPPRPEKCAVHRR